MSELLFEIFQRVKTFQINFWKYQDQKYFCPYQLASIGYFVSKPFIIQCCVCHHQVDFQLQITNPQEKLKNQVYKHQENCIYHNQKMLQIKKQDLYLKMDQIISQLKVSYKILEDQKKYPFLNIFQINKLLTNDVFTFKKVLQGYQLNQKQIKISFYLQFFGWKIIKNNEQIEAQCVCCGRKLKTTNFESTEFDKQYQYSNISAQKLFNPIEQHRYFCFWVNKNLQGFCGWQILLQHLYDKMIESKSLFSKRLPQQTKKIRVQLDKYLQNFQIKATEQFQKIKQIIKNCVQIRDQISSQTQKKRVLPDYDFMGQFLINIDDQIKNKVKKIKLDQ